MNDPSTTERRPRPRVGRRSGTRAPLRSGRSGHCRPRTTRPGRPASGPPAGRAPRRQRRAGERRVGDVTRAEARLQRGHHPQRHAGPAGRRQHAVQVGEPGGGEQPASRRGRPDERLDRPTRSTRHRQTADADDHQPEPQSLGAQQPPRGRPVAGREVTAAVQEDARDDGGRRRRRAPLGHGRHSPTAAPARERRVRGEKRQKQSESGHAGGQS